jgi:uncharacterized protein
MDTLVVYEAETSHVRLVPFRRAFRFKMLVIDIDLRHLAEAGRGLRLFGVNRGALFSFAGRDHGNRTDASPLDWAIKRFADAGLDVSGCDVRLLCIPRAFGYGFKPLSLIFAIAPDGTARGVIFEVHNTFGETHAYVAPWDGKAQLETRKAFHVSPFFDRSADYRFSLTLPGERFSLKIENNRDGTPEHFATWIGSKRKPTDLLFLLSALRMPFMTLGVVAGIHWHALWIWLRGGRYHSKPDPISPGQTIAVPRDR